MLEIEYAPSFLRQLKKLPPTLQTEALQKIALFKHRENHRQLEVHKLTGRMQGKFSFSINYKDRVVFKWLSKNSAGFFAIGDHSIYK